MATFIATALLGFLVFGVAVLIINYSKKRSVNSKHELTGMCHCSGGVSCCSTIKNIEKNRMTGRR